MLTKYSRWFSVALERTVSRKGSDFFPQTFVLKGILGCEFTFFLGLLPAGGNLFKLSFS